MPTTRFNPAEPPAARDITLLKGPHSYRFVAVDGDEATLLDAASSLAGRTDSDFDWFDVALIAHEMGRRLTTHLHPGSTRTPHAP